MKVEEFIEEEKALLDKYKENVKQHPDLDMDAEQEEWREFFDFWVELEEADERSPN